MLRLFVKTLTVDEKHYLLTRDNLTQAIEVQLSRTQKTFCQFCFAFLETLLNFKYSQKTMTLIADVFVEIMAPKNIVR